MIENFTTRPACEFWVFEWSGDDVPVVFFSNPKVSTNVIYTITELEKVLLRSDKENSFIPVPRKVLQRAWDSRDVLKKDLAA